MVLGLLGVAVLAGVGFDWLTARLAPARRRLAAVVIGGLLLVEFSAIPYKGVPYRLDIPAADLWVARQPKPFSIAEVPVDDVRAIPVELHAAFDGALAEDGARIQRDPARPS